MYVRNAWFVLAFTLWFSASAFGWEEKPGAAYDVGDGWVIGLNQQPGGFGIYRWNGAGWDPMPGGAVRIGGTYTTPWMVDDRQDIFRWTGTGWEQLPGAAYDVADGWVIGLNAKDGGYGIYRWNGNGWDGMPGAGVRIGGTYTTPWLVNDRDEVFRWTGSDWQQLPGAAYDVADGWVIGLSPDAAGFGIYRWDGAVWEQMPGSGVGIGGAGGPPWMIDSHNAIFRW